MSAEHSPYWPLDGLRLSVGDNLTLRPVVEADLDELGDLLPADLEANPNIPRPFGVADRVSGAIALRQEHWTALGSWTPDSWDLGFVVRYRERSIGMQGLEGEDFRLLRTVETASWLAADFRGRGLGKLMRIAVLALAFDGLDAEIALTEAWSDNAASLGVSRSLGYLANGSVRHKRDGGAAEMPRMRMNRSDWRAVPRPEVEISGLEACLPWFLGPLPKEQRGGSAQADEPHGER
jgi:RimJ/RimL family protein N-acetyltransferase